MCCHNHTSPVTVRTAKQLQVLTHFVPTSLSSPFIPGRDADHRFGFTSLCKSSALAYYRMPGILYFPSSCHNYVQPISHVHDSTRCSSSRLKVFVSKSSVVLRRRRNTEPSFSELPLFLRLPSIHSQKTVRRRKTGRHPSESESRLSPWLHLTIDAQAPAEVRFDATTEWVARCQLLSAINRIRSLFPLFAQPLSLSVRVLPTLLLLLLLSLMFLSHIQDTSSVFSSLTLINVWLN